MSGIPVLKVCLFKSGLFLAALVAMLLSFAPASAQPRVKFSAEFRVALEPHGQWEHHDRWGEVWIPKRDRDWRPHTVGRWIYTNEWGWYLAAGEDEADTP